MCFAAYSGPGLILLRATHRDRGEWTLPSYRAEKIVGSNTGKSAAVSYSPENDEISLSKSIFFGGGILNCLYLSSDKLYPDSLRLFSQTGNLWLMRNIPAQSNHPPRVFALSWQVMPAMLAF